MTNHIIAAIDDMRARLVEATETDARDAASYRALRALGEGGRLLDRERLFDRLFAIVDATGRFIGDVGPDLATETALALYVGALSDEAIDALGQAYFDHPDEKGLWRRSSEETRAKVSAALRVGQEAALRRVLGPSFEVPALASECNSAILKARSDACNEAMVRADREKARADKADERADRLAAEVEALRALPNTISALDLEADMPGRMSATERYRWIVRWALATVPRASTTAPAVEPPPRCGICGQGVSRKPDRPHECKGFPAGPKAARHAEQFAAPDLATDEEIDASDCPKPTGHGLGVSLSKWFSHGETYRGTYDDAVQGWLVRRVVALGRGGVR